MYMCVHACVSVHMCERPCTGVHACVCLCMRGYVYIGPHRCVYLCAWVHVSVNVHECVHTCVYSMFNSQRFPNLPLVLGGPCLRKTGG